MSAAAEVKTTKTTIRYETKTCGRCGGSGRYSFNAMHGDRCYGCGGCGKVLTPAGKRAMAKIDAWKVANLSLPIIAVEAGMLIDGLRLTKSDRARATVGAHSNWPHRDGGSSLVNGQYVAYNSVSVTFHVTRNGQPTPCHYSAAETSTVRRAPNSDEFAQMVEVARKTKGAIVSEE